MKRFLLGGALGILCISACSGGDDEGATSPPVRSTVRQASESSPTPLTAADVLRLSDEAMNQLTFVRVEGTLGLFEYQAPDRLQGWDSSDVSWCLIGKQYWYRDPAEGWGNWHVRHENRKAFKWPDFTRFTGTATRDGFFDREATEARNVRFLAGHEYGGLPAYVIGYDIDAMTIEGPVLVEQIEWIAKDSLLLLARETANNDPWGDPEPTFESYSEFDESAPLDCVGAALTAVP